jgi:hypothetical protein
MNGPGQVLPLMTAGNDGALRWRVADTDWAKCPQGILAQRSAGSRVTRPRPVFSNIGSIIEGTQPSPRVIWLSPR